MIEWYARLVYILWL